MDAKDILGLPKNSLPIPQEKKSRPPKDSQRKPDGISREVISISISICVCEFWFSSLKFVEFRLEFVLGCFGNVGVCTYGWFGASNARDRFVSIEKAASKGREGKFFCRFW